MLKCEGTTITYMKCNYNAKYDGYCFHHKDLDTCSSCDERKARDLCYYCHEHNINLESFNDVIENDIIENDVIENDIIENDVIENDINENDIIENDIIENEIIGNDSDDSSTDYIMESSDNINNTRDLLILQSLLRHTLGVYMPVQISTSSVNNNVQILTSSVNNPVQNLIIPYENLVPLKPFFSPHETKNIQKLTDKLNVMDKNDFIDHLNVKNIGHFDNEDKCPICFTKLSINQQDILMLACSHKIHKECFNNCVEHNIFKCSLCMDQILKEYDILTECKDMIDENIKSSINRLDPDNVDVLLFNRILEQSSLDYFINKIKKHLYF